MSELAGSDYMGEVDLFGLDEFGEPVGLKTMWGALIGSGLGTGLAIGLRRFSTAGSMWANNAEGVAFLLTSAVGGAMVASHKTRAAGWTAIAASAVNNGLRYLDQMMGGSSMGGWGEATVDPARAFYGHGLGIATTEPRQNLAGAGGLPTLVGHDASLGASASQVQVMGGPALSGLSSLYGATLFGAGK